MSASSWVPEWMKFSLLDMTPYDRQGWFWLIESYQQDYPFLWLFSLLYSAVLVVLILRPVSYAPRLALGLLAASWLWCGWMFQIQHHATMNWAATQIGWVFILQAALLVLVAIFGKTLAWHSLNVGTGFSTGSSSGSPEKASFLSTRVFSAYSNLAAFSILSLALLYPLIGWFEGRAVPQLEWPGFMATPVTLTTVGVLALLKGRLRFALLLIPVLWAFISAAFMLKLELLEPYIATLALCALIVSVLQRKLKA